jgi:hypothetical protein
MGSINFLSQVCSIVKQYFATSIAFGDLRSTAFEVSLRNLFQLESHTLLLCLKPLVSGRLEPHNSLYETMILNTDAVQELVRTPIFTKSSEDPYLEIVCWTH